MKKWGVLLALLLMTTACTTGADSLVKVQLPEVRLADTPVTDFYAYEWGDDTLCVRFYYGQDERIVIPAEINGIPVRVVDLAFRQGNEYVREVVIPEGVTSVHGFSSWSALESVSLPSTLETIDGAFWGCTNLKNVVIPENVKYLLNSPFGHYSGELRIPATVIRWDAYNRNQYPNTTFYVENNSTALAVCRNAKLKYRIIGEEVPERGIFYYRQLEDGTLEITGYYGVDTAVVIPAEIDGKRVSGIGYEAFYYNDTFQKVTISEGITSIDYRAFAACSQLTEVIIPGSVQTVRQQAFKNCTGLHQVTISSGVQAIESDAFLGCTSLMELYVPASVTEIGNRVWQQMDYPNTTLIVEMKSDALRFAMDYGAAYRVVGYEPGAQIAWFDYELDADGHALITHYYGTETTLRIPSQIDGYPVKGTGSYALRYNTTATTVIFEDGITLIGEFSLPEQVERVTLPKTVKTLGYGCFQYTPSLTAVDLPNGLEVIEESVFRESGITSVVIPDSVTRIDDYAFIDCASLKSVVIPGAAKLGMSVFRGCASLTGVTIKPGLTEIGSNDFYECKSLETVSLPASVSKIGSWAFAYCDRLSRIDLAGVEVIDENAFIADGALTQITFPTTLREIGASAFAGSGLKEVRLPESVSTVGQGAFSMCESLTGVSIPGSVYRLGEEAFKDAFRLAYVVIGEGVHDIGASAFSGTGIRSIVLPASVEVVGAYAFTACSALTSVTMSGTNTIGRGAFSDCRTLSQVTLGDALTDIRAYAFANLPALRSLSLPASIIHMDGDIFSGTSIQLVVDSGSIAHRYAIDNKIPYTLRASGGTSGDLPKLIVSSDSVLNRQIDAAAMDIAHLGNLYLLTDEFDSLIGTVPDGYYPYIACYRGFAVQVTSYDRNRVPSSITVRLDGESPTTAADSVILMFSGVDKNEETFVQYHVASLYSRYGINQQSLSFTLSGEELRQLGDAGIAAVMAYTVSFRPLPVVGDANEDGAVNWQDATAMLNALCGGGQVSVFADLDGDQALTLDDITLLMQMLTAN